MTNTTIEAEVVNPEPSTSMALAVRKEQPVGLFGTNEPAAVVEKATGVANALKDVIVKQGLVSKISGKEYPRCEAWTLLGTMLGVFPVTVWTKQIEDGWEARVEARTRDGATIGAAEAQCLRSERNWRDRDDFALRSMAQTRATAKCLRMPLGFVMTLAGFEATPAEEMTFESQKGGDQQSQNRVKSSQARFSSPGATKTPPAGKAPQAQSAGQAPGPNPPPREAKQAIFADQDTLKRLLGNLRDCQDLALEYFRKLDNPAVLLPNEHLTQLPLEFVPVTRRQFENLMAAITDFGNGGEAKHAFAPNPLPPGKAPANKQKAPPKAAEPPPAKAPPPPSVQGAKAKDPEWFWPVVCPIPNKGQKRDEYMRSPDTIRGLYNAMKTGDQAAQKRLWGFAKHWNPEPREFRGKVYPVSDADRAFREALDSFCEWEEKHGKDTEHQQGKDTPNDLPEGPEQENDDLPF